MPKSESVASESDGEGMKVEKYAGDLTGEGIDRHFCSTRHFGYETENQ